MCVCKRIDIYMILTSVGHGFRFMYMLSRCVVTFVHAHNCIIVTRLDPTGKV